MMLGGVTMSVKTIQVTIEDSMLEKVDRLVQQMNITRSAAIRQALTQWIHERYMEELDRLDEEGYRRQPVGPDEFWVAADKRPRFEEWPWEDA